MIRFHSHWDFKFLKGQLDDNNFYGNKSKNKINEKFLFIAILNFLNTTLALLHKVKKIKYIKQIQINTVALYNVQSKRYLHCIKMKNEVRNIKGKISE